MSSKDTSPRPSQLGKDSADIRAEVQEALDAKDTWRVYVKEWIVRWTGPEDWCRAVFVEKYQGRVTDHDWRIVDHPRLPFLQVLEIRLWNLRSECKLQSDADLERRRLQSAGVDCALVGRHTRSEVELTDYGVKKLKGS